MTTLPHEENHQTYTPTEENRQTYTPTTKLTPPYYRVPSTTIAITTHTFNNFVVKDIESASLTYEERSYVALRRG